MPHRRRAGHECARRSRAARAHAPGIVHREGARHVHDNRAFARVGSTPFGRVTSGLEAVDALYSGYGDGPPRGRGPDQSQIRARGNAYLAKDFPKLDYIRTATIEK